MKMPFQLMTVNRGLNVCFVFLVWPLDPSRLCQPSPMEVKDVGSLNLFLQGFILCFFFFLLLVAYSLLPLCVYLRGGNVAAGGPEPKSAVYTF